MDATLLSTNSNLFNSNSVPPIAQLRRFFSIRLNQLTHGCLSELSRLRSGCSARGFGAVDRRSIRPQFAAKGGYWKSHAVPAGASDAAALSSDAIVLHVRGMLCEGCVASVKRILESQEPVSSASVNLTTETAVVWPVSDAKVEPGWQKNLGQALAKHLNSCGFESNIRGASSATGVGFIEGGFAFAPVTQISSLHKLERIISLKHELTSDILFKHIL